MIIICQAVVVMIALYLGLESIARTTVFIIVFSILSFVLSTVLALKDMDFMLLLPLATDRPSRILAIPVYGDRLAFQSAGAVSVVYPSG